MSADPFEQVAEFAAWAASTQRPLYPAQEEALLEIAAGSNVIVNTPTGSGKSLVALGAHRLALAEGRRSFYTAPIKALVSEKFFDLCRQLGSDNVGMLTGDAAVNGQAPVVCCTAEVLANIALRGGEAGAQVVMDEFHFYADPDRGWAWQVPLLTLNDAQFILMSATLGDVRRFEADLTRRTGRPTVTVSGSTRPVPLSYRYARTAIHTTIDEVLAAAGAPVYIVHFTQADAVERAQALTSVNVASRAEKDAIAVELTHARFSPGFGRTLNRFVRHGVGVHHAGMLPKYRLLVERLTQAGLLKVICGTDTLGVGINVPIRTVLFTGLSKFDGTTSRLLTAREFHQIAGRAGRAGFDTEGTVIVQAPEHVIENERAKEKAGDDPRKRRKLVASKPPRGFVPWTHDTFDRLVSSPPEPLASSFRVSHAMLLNVLDRPADGCGAMRRLLTDNHEPRPAQRTHVRRAIAIYRSLLAAGVVVRLDDDVRVAVDLQRDFALNQPLSPFVLEALPHVDTALDVLSIVESTLEDPGTVLSAQRDKLVAETLAALKADGVEYEERMAIIEKIEHPKPLRELIYGLFDTYRVQHPWVGDHNIRPKSVARDLYERAMGFADYVAYYGVARSEGLVLRYLTDAYKGLVQTVPEDAKSEELLDLTEWLGELVRQVDSSLLDEWSRLRDPTAPPGGERPPPVTGNDRAFRVMVRNEAFRRVQLCARRDWAALGSLDGERGWDAARWSSALDPFFGEYDLIDTGPRARGSDLFQVLDGTVRQMLTDAEGPTPWAVVLTIDVAASADQGVAVLHPEEVSRIGTTNF